MIHWCSIFNWMAAWYVSCRTRRVIKHRRLRHRRGLETPGTTSHLVFHPERKTASPEEPHLHFTEPAHIHTSSGWATQAFSTARHASLARAPPPVFLRALRRTAAAHHHKAPDMHRRSALDVHAYLILPPPELAAGRQQWHDEHERRGEAGVGNRAAGLPEIFRATRQTRTTTTSCAATTDVPYWASTLTRARVSSPSLSRCACVWARARALLRHVRSLSFSRSRPAPHAHRRCPGGTSSTCTSKRIKYGSTQDPDICSYTYIKAESRRRTISA